MFHHEHFYYKLPNTEVIELLSVREDTLVLSFDFLLYMTSLNLHHPGVKGLMAGEDKHAAAVIINLLKAGLTASPRSAGATCLTFFFSKKRKTSTQPPRAVTASASWSWDQRTRADNAVKVRGADAGAPNATSSSRSGDNPGSSWARFIHTNNKKSHKMLNELARGVKTSKHDERWLTFTSACGRHHVGGISHCPD